MLPGWQNAKSLKDARDLAKHETKLSRDPRHLLVWSYKVPYVSKRNFYLI
jgi:hypothetical protein